MGFDQARVEEVKQRAEILDVVSDFVSLKKSGQSYKGLSPFTNEKTPSFFVNPSLNIYKCFSSGKGGDPISFLMELEGMSYVEALKFLAEKYDIDLGEDDAPVENTEKDHLLGVLRFACNFFKENLKIGEGLQVGYAYFRERGFDDETIEKFELGYSLEKWGALHEKALQVGYNEEYLEKSGLLVVKENKKYDRFRGRVVFPIHNLSGKVVAFGARTLKKDKKEPKYLNTNETQVYHKSNILYGLYQAKQLIRNADNCYLVEGYTDVISLHQAGVGNVVASSGTSLTVEQIKSIKRYSENITILFDGDQAGIAASLRGIDLILEQGANVKVVLFPEGEDPDSFARKQGKALLEDYLVKHQQDFITFKSNLVAEETANDPIARANVIKDIITSIARIPDSIKRSVYIKQASQALEIEEQTLYAELNKITLGQRKKDFYKEKQKEEPFQPEEKSLPDGLTIDDQILIQEKESIRLLLYYGFSDVDEQKLCNYLFQELHDVSFSQPVYKKILEIYSAQLQEGMIPDLEYFVKSEDEEIKKVAIDLAAEKDKYKISEYWETRYQIFVTKEEDVINKSVYTNIVRLKHRAIRKMINDNLQALKKIASANGEGQDEQIIQHQSIHQELKKAEATYAKILGMVIT